jgi:hypothetical protein
MEKSLDLVSIILLSLDALATFDNCNLTLALPGLRKFQLCFLLVLFSRVISVLHNAGVRVPNEAAS